ncbi:NAD(P)/FAD-dependent oxidoreductase [Streptomyces sp. LP05-1]|uniref:NAD(P)/FAD-dependent oxidoreductase n=1 Tax=Streptomyces pyxinae TaxID=2970734 RepID=A0ABT2CHZ7_9ACTN|nr:NAD(P)/FAD-dependent oxidoreductase [Streptomyces sp. LP05-1]MCS0637049.1 NAD(P)/FAD-dependent oxidoreductase [Streptomyces sp. LP05-1]
MLIVGAGLAGLGAAIRLQQAGIRDFVVLERSDDIGGTWRDNRYPGAACDVPGLLYAYSFGPAPRWSSTPPAAEEILHHLRECADGLRLGARLRLNCEVLEARWSDEVGLWYVQASGFRCRARHLIVATGFLDRPHVPGIPGLDTFGGDAFHTSRWVGGWDPAGKHVAVIGTGASAVQCVPPLAARAASLTVYQRTPPWVLPRLGRRVRPAEAALYRRFPRLRRLARTAVYWYRESWVLGFTGPLRRILGPGLEALAHLHRRRQVADRALRRRLTPDYRFGCKRVVLSNDYYPALQRSGVELVTDPVDHITAGAIVTRDGSTRAADLIVFGTGFTAGRPAVAERITGRAGRRLAETWRPGMSAHHNVMVAGFPNLFLLLGPNSGLGHSSLTLMLEAQLGYVTSCLAHLERHGLAEVEVLPGTQHAHADRVRRRMRHTVWESGGCDSWYLDGEHGHNTALWPGSVASYRARTRSFRADGHRVRPLDT